MPPESVQSFLSLAIGFAFAGVIASGYQALTRRPLSFLLLTRNARAALAAMPVLVMAAPFLIMRNTIRGGRFEHRPMQFVMLATVLAGLWSLASGTLVVVALRAFGVLSV